MFNIYSRFRNSKILQWGNKTNYCRCTFIQKYSLYYHSYINTRKQHWNNKNGNSIAISTFYDDDFKKIT